MNLLYRFNRGEVPVEKVFDLDKWARFVVVNAMLAGKHALRWHNLRFYFNLETRLLEPVGFDNSTNQTKYGAWYFEKKFMESFTIVL